VRLKNSKCYEQSHQVIENKGPHFGKPIGCGKQKGWTLKANMSLIKQVVIRWQGEKVYGDGEKRYKSRNRAGQPCSRDKDCDK
jgi:hypothetical protein